MLAQNCVYMAFAIDELFRRSNRPIKRLLAYRARGDNLCT